jgi:hypothetical protein
MFKMKFEKFTKKELLWIAIFGVAFLIGAYLDNLTLTGV